MDDYGVTQDLTRVRRRARPTPKFGRRYCAFLGAQEFADRLGQKKSRPADASAGRLLVSAPQIRREIPGKSIWRETPPANKSEHGEPEKAGR
jgi:hypothetical protein